MVSSISLLYLIGTVVLIGIMDSTNLASSNDTGTGTTTPPPGTTSSTTASATASDNKTATTTVALNTTTTESLKVVNETYEYTPNVKRQPATTATANNADKGARKTALLIIVALAVYSSISIF